MVATVERLKAENSEVFGDNREKVVAKNVIGVYQIIRSWYQ